MHTVLRPVQILRGRGAVSAPAHRFAQSSVFADKQLWPQLPPDDVSVTPQVSQPKGLQTQVQTELAKSLIQRNQSPDVFFDLSINPYRGCEHGCVYCYARPQHAFIELSPGIDFETRLFAKTNAAQVFEKELTAPGYHCLPINIGSVTDAYQPVEKAWQLTRQCLQVAQAFNQPVSIITKSSLIERDVDLLAAMAKKQQAVVYITITTLEADLARIWEPRACAPWRRLLTVQRLAQAGVPVGVLVAPIVPFVNDHQLEAVLKAAAKAGASTAHYTILRLPHELKAVFVDWLQAHRPLAAKRVMARLQDMRGGKINDARFNTRMKGEGPWADIIRMRFGLARKQAGLSPKRQPLDTSQFLVPSAQASLF
jgi:DNA repair photolyase